MQGNNVAETSSTPKGARSRRRQW